MSLTIDTLLTGVWFSLDGYCWLSAQHSTFLLFFIWKIFGKEMNQMVDKDFACDCIPIQSIAF